MPYLLAVTLLWAFSFSLIGEYLAGRVDSDFAVLIRVAIAALIFVPYMRWRGLPKHLLGGFWLAGALQFGIIVQRPNGGNRAFETSSAGTAPRSNPKFANWTVIGRGGSGNDSTSWLALVHTCKTRVWVSRP